MQKSGNRQEKVANNGFGYLFDVLKAGMVAVALAVILLLIGSVLISTGMLPESWMGGSVMAAYVLSSMFGGLFGVKRIKKRTLLVGLASGLIMFLMLAIMGALWSGGDIDGANCAVVVGSCLCGGGIAGVLGGTSHRKRR